MRVSAWTVKVRPLILISSLRNRFFCGVRLLTLAMVSFSVRQCLQLFFSFPIAFLIESLEDFFLFSFLGYASVSLVLREVLESLIVKTVVKRVQPRSSQRLRASTSEGVFRALWCATVLSGSRIRAFR
jgi:hypothetical protein